MRSKIASACIAGFWYTFGIILRHLIYMDCQVTFWNGFEVLLFVIMRERKNVDFTKDEANISKGKFNEQFNISGPFDNQVLERLKSSSGCQPTSSQFTCCFIFLRKNKEDDIDPGRGQEFQRCIDVSWMNLYWDTNEFVSLALRVCSY